MADQIDSVTGGGNGFSLDFFGYSQVVFNVPSGETFDVYIDDDYRASPSQSDGKYDITLNTLKAYKTTSPINVSFVFPGQFSQPDPNYTSEFTVSWIDPTEGTASDDDLQQIQNDLSNYVKKSEINGFIEQWWEDEVRPELEQINTTLQNILTQHTVIASEMETIDTAIQRIRDLADHPSGPGIRTVSPYGYLGNAILYQLYVKQAQAIADSEASPADQAESLNKLNEIINELSSNLDPNQGGFD